MPLPLLVRRTCSIASVLGGLWSTFSVAVIQKAIGGLSTPETLMRNYSNQGVFASLAGMSGPLLAGYAIELVGYVNGLLVLFPLVLVVAIMLVAVRRTQPGAPQKAQDARRGGCATRWRDNLQSTTCAVLENNRQVFGSLAMR